jgi:hypothetical protein
LSGARYLQSVARTDDDACLIFHHEPDGKDLCYLGWCHGPTGTSQLFYRLYQATGDKSWMSWVERCARAILKSGIPEKEHPGFWNNVGQCCGSAGVAEFFLSLHRITEKQEYLDFARRLTAVGSGRAPHPAEASVCPDQPDAGSGRDRPLSAPSGCLRAGQETPHRPS